MKEEKVDLLIKEIVKIKPSEFAAFKKAFEDFITEWDT